MFMANGKAVQFVFSTKLTKIKHQHQTTSRSAPDKNFKAHVDLTDLSGNWWTFHNHASQKICSVFKLVANFISAIQTVIIAHPSSLPTLLGSVSVLVAWFPMPEFSHGLHLVEGSPHFTSLLLVVLSNFVHFCDQMTNVCLCHIANPPTAATFQSQTFGNHICNSH